jgi:uncharacterized protein
MRVFLEQIGPEGFDLDEPMPAHWITTTLGAGSSYEPQGDGHLTAHLDELDRGVVQVHGRARLDLQAPCARCLEPVPLHLDTTLEVTLFPVGQEPQAETSGEIADDDMGVSTYDGIEIDLGNLVRDEVFLALPMIPLCREDCRGLCPTCGENLNVKPCGCRPGEDHPMAALMQIKLS